MVYRWVYFDDGDQYEWNFAARLGEVAGDGGEIFDRGGDGGDRAEYSSGAVGPQWDEADSSGAAVLDFLSDGVAGGAGLVGDHVG